MGHPLDASTYGRSFLYGTDDGLLSLGFVMGLDYRDPSLDGHRETQHFKQHPYVRSLLEGGRLVGYGAKAIPLGGYYAMPALVIDGPVLVGDSAGFPNARRPKG